jgi:hypothetical protein
MGLGMAPSAGVCGMHAVWLPPFNSKDMQVTLAVLAYLPSFRWMLVAMQGLTGVVHAPRMGQQHCTGSEVT